MRYTKKPVTVEAVQFMGLTDFGDPQFDTTPSSGEVPEWLMEAVAGPEGSEGSMWTAPGQAFIGEGEPPKELFIGTKEGQHIASPGDWIIQGIKGEIYPCKPDIFAATYDVATDDPGPAWKEGDTLSAPKDETPGDMLARLGVDGQAWAREFVDMFTGKSIGDDPASHGVDIMTAWFANAIMAGYDRGREQGWKEDAPYGHERVDPATGSEDCPKLEALDTSGRQAVAAAMDRAGEVLDPVFATREPRSYVIGEGFKTVGDSDGDDGA